MADEESEEGRVRALHGLTSKAGPKRTRQVLEDPEDDNLGEACLNVGNTKSNRSSKRDGRFHLKAHVEYGDTVSERNLFKIHDYACRWRAVLPATSRKPQKQVAGVACYVAAIESERKLRDFKPKSLPQPTWTSADKALFRQGLLEYARKENMPNEGMDRVHYLQHHLMQCRYSKKACMRMLRSEHKLMRSRGDFSQPPCVEGVSIDSDSDEGCAHEEEDSALLLPDDCNVAALGL